MPSVDWNRRQWGQDYRWPQGGDEWNDLASHCGQPYTEWKDALIETFIAPHAVDADVLEIAPGYGRWTEFLARSARRVVLVDINENCLSACQKRFEHLTHIEYHLGDGESLPVQDASLDFVWSFDSFVHMDPPVVRAYLREIGRVLRPGGSAVVHHAGKRSWSLALTPVTVRLGTPGRVLQRLASQGRLLDDGWRSNVTGRMVADWAQAAGMVVAQTRSWGAENQYDVAKYRDMISGLRKPLS
jgi:ubiquinone/menaquinone biosynthesis C-methylase UbiE